MNFVAAILYAMSASSLLAVLLGFLRGGLDHSSAALALGGGLLVVSFALWQGRNSSTRSQPPSLPEWLAIIAFALVSLRIFLWVEFFDGDEIKVLFDNNLGDLPLHLTYVRYLANGVPFWPDNPIFTGGTLTYPIGIDLFHSLFVLLGMDVFRGFIWIGLLGAALTGAALWRWGRGIALVGFLANGGLAGFEIFHAAKLADFQAMLAWKSIALALFATQRGLLFALPAGLLLLSSWRSRFFGVDAGVRPAAKKPPRRKRSSSADPEIQAESDNWRLPVWGEVLLYASLPLFHFHTFLFLSVLLGVWLVFRRQEWRGLLQLIGSALAPATVLVFLITGGLKGGHLLGWKPGWMWNDQGFLDWCQAHWPMNSAEMISFTFAPLALTFDSQTTPLWIAGLTFWPINFGVLPIFVGLLVAKLCRPQSSMWARLVVFPALGIFLICCFVKFAPWEWDNTKLMVWSYLVILPFLWSEVLSRWPRWGQTLAVVMLIFSGFISTLGGVDGSHAGQTIAVRSELDGVADGLRGIPARERFAGAPTYNHPLLLNGRKMVLGYEGHVRSHGLDWDEPAGKLKALMNGDEHWQALAAELGVRYLFWGWRESEEYQDSSQPWRKSTRLVASGEWGAIYDLRSAPTAAPELPDMKE